MSTRTKPIRNSLRRHRIILGLLATAAVIGSLLGHQFWMHQSHIRGWDHMFISGSLATLLGLWLATLLPARFELMLGRLGDRCALKSTSGPLNADQLQQLRKTLDDWARLLSIVIGAVFGLGMGVIWASVTLIGDSSERSFDAYAGPLFGAVAAALVGWVLGRMLATGLFALALRFQQITLEVTPAHPDGAAGLKPLGDYYLAQALLLAFPAAYLAAWSLLILLDITSRYQGWLEPYLGLIALAICLELAAFALPLWSVHRVMNTERQDRLARIDQELGSTVADLHRQLDTDQPSQRRRELRRQLAHLTTRYQEAEAMPTWPLDQSLRRRLTIGNLFLLVPLVGQIAKLAQ